MKLAGGITTHSTGARVSLIFIVNLSVAALNARPVNSGVRRLLDENDCRFMWKPLSENKLMDMIDEAELFMSPGCRKFWDYIKINPQKWSLSPWGDEGGGFWVVAVIGNTCTYYNDIEDGFNFSSYKTFGQIDDYYCNQSDLLPAINGFYQRVVNETKGDA